jgi:hypothetical protein
MPVRPAVVLTLSYFAPGDTNVFAGPIRQHSNLSTKLSALALFSVPLLPVDDVLSEREVFPTGDVSGRHDVPIGPEGLER